jgi:hypothetical protein
MAWCLSTGPTLFLPSTYSFCPFFISNVFLLSLSLHIFRAFVFFSIAFSRCDLFLIIYFCFILFPFSVIPLALSELSLGSQRRAADTPQGVAPGPRWWGWITGHGALNDLNHTADCCWQGRSAKEFPGNQCPRRIWHAHCRQFPTTQARPVIPTQLVIILPLLWSPKVHHRVHTSSP